MRDFNVVKLQGNFWTALVIVYVAAGLIIVFWNRAVKWGRKS
ncbi:MAG: hypothetical protein JWM59_2960 [Verrucomicrobiales bacterium]|nr:hypothetical protein [Verrucomicrobiales bacterium]